MNQLAKQLMREIAGIDANDAETACLTRETFADWLTLAEGMVPIISQEPDGYPRLGCGTLAKIGMTVWTKDGQNGWTIAGLFHDRAAYTTCDGPRVTHSELFAVKP